MQLRYASLKPKFPLQHCEEFTFHPVLLRKLDVQRRSDFEESVNLSHSTRLLAYTSVGIVCMSNYITLIFAK